MRNIDKLKLLDVTGLTEFLLDWDINKLNDYMCVECSNKDECDTNGECTYMDEDMVLDWLQSNKHFYFD